MLVINTSGEGFEEKTHYGFWKHDPQSTLMEIVMLTALLESIEFEPAHRKIMRTLLKEAKQRYDSSNSTN